MVSVARHSRDKIACVTGEAHPVRDIHPRPQSSFHSAPLLTKRPAASSVAGINGFASFGAYSSTKFAVRSLNQTAALEFAPHGITCNVYCPSPIDTNMWTTIDKDLSTAAKVNTGDVTKQVSWPL